MRGQFGLLIELQHLDDRLRALQHEQYGLPQKLLPYEQVCQKAREALAQLFDSVEDTERHRRTLERELDSLQTQLAKTQSKLREVKTNKEYSAVLAEIDTGKQHIAVLEDQVLDLMERAEQQRQAHQAQEQNVQEAMRDLAEQEAHTQQAHTALAQQISAEQTKRQALVDGLEANLYATYQRLLSQRDKKAVVVVQGGACTGCHLKVQPQLVSEIRQQEKLHTCPHCRRILLWPAE